jgi:hypothetical protein
MKRMAIPMIAVEEGKGAKDMCRTYYMYSLVDVERACIVKRRFPPQKSMPDCSCGNIDRE